MMLEILSVICGIVGIGVLWFKTDFLVEYIILFRLNKIFPSILNDINGYTKQMTTSPLSIHSFPEYLSSKHDNFVVKLFSCFTCLSFWLSILGSTILANLYLFPIIYIGSLFGFFTLSRLMEK